MPPTKKAAPPKAAPAQKAPAAKKAAPAAKTSAGAAGRAGAKADAKAVLKGGVAGGAKRAGQRAGDAAKHGGAAGGRAGPGGMKLPGGKKPAKKAAAPPPADAGPKHAKPGGPKLPSAPSVPKAAYSTQPRRLLLGEYALCLIVLGLGSLVAPKGSNNGVPRLMVKASGLSGLFLLLGLVSSGGTAAAKVAVAFGGLVTVTYLVSSSDATDVANYLGGFFSKGGLSGQAAAAGGAAGAEVGAAP